MRRWAHVGLVLGQRRRRWATKKQRWPNVSCFLGGRLMLVINSGNSTLSQTLTVDLHAGEVHPDAVETSAFWLKANSVYTVGILGNVRGDRPTIVCDIHRQLTVSSS